MWTLYVNKIIIIKICFLLFCCSQLLKKLFLLVLSSVTTGWAKNLALVLKIASIMDHFPGYRN